MGQVPSEWGINKPVWMGAALVFGVPVLMCWSNGLRWSWLLDEYPPGLVLSAWWFSDFHLPLDDFLDTTTWGPPNYPWVTGDPL